MNGERLDSLSLLAAHSTYALSQDVHFSHHSFSVTALVVLEKLDLSCGYAILVASHERRAISPSQRSV